MTFRFKDGEHLVRLLLIFVLGGVAFAAVRAKVVPPDFGRDGHYRPGAVTDEMARPLKHAGQAACADCHADVVEKRSAARHAAIACEACHGPLAKHASGELAKPERPNGRDLCVRCHAARTGKPSQYPTVVVADHAGEEKCITCHTPHNPKIQ
jgi:cytochrome c7-like protein